MQGGCFSVILASCLASILKAKETAQDSIRNGLTLHLFQIGAMTPPGIKSNAKILPIQSCVPSLKS